MNDTERSLDLCALEKQIYDKIVSLNNLEKALDKFVLVADCRKGVEEARKDSAQLMYSLLKVDELDSEEVLLRLEITHSTIDKRKQDCMKDKAQAEMKTNNVRECKKLYEQIIPAIHQARARNVTCEIQRRNEKDINAKKHHANAYYDDVIDGEDCILNYMFQSICNPETENDSRGRESEAKDNNVPEASNYRRTDQLENYPGDTPMASKNKKSELREVFEKTGLCTTSEHPVSDELRKGKDCIASRAAPPVSTSTKGNESNLNFKRKKDSRLTQNIAKFLECFKWESSLPSK